MNHQAPSGAVTKQADTQRATDSFMAEEDVFDILDHIPSPLAFVSNDASFEVLYVNHAFTRTLGYEIADVRTVFNWTALVYTDSQVRQQRLSSWQADVNAAIHNRSLVPDRESHLRCKDHSYRDVIIQTSVLRTLLLLTFTDITDSKYLANKLVESERQFRSFVEGANDIIYTLDLHGRFTYISPNYQNIFGVDPTTLLNKPFSEVLHPHDLPSALESFSSALQGNRVTEIEYRVHHSDGRWLWQSSNIGPILDEANRISTIIGVGRDIHQHKHYENELKQAKEAAEELNRALQAANQQLNHFATTDALTNLSNRRHFEDRITHEMSMADRYQQPLSLLLFDIDHFKIVNDTFGHLAGDQVLVELSNLVRQKIRATDLPCRWGGEEFMILLPNTGAQEAMLVAEKLRKTFANHKIADVGFTTSSFGVATYHAKESLDSWIGRIDGALYEAKNAGRNTVRFAHT